MKKVHDKTQLMFGKIAKRFAIPSEIVFESGRYLLRLGRCEVTYDFFNRSFEVMNTQNGVEKRFDYWEDVARFLHYEVGLPFTKRGVIKPAMYRNRGDRPQTLYKPPATRKFADTWV